MEIKEKSLQEVCKDFNIQVKSIAGEVHFCEKKDKLGLIFYAKGLKSPVYDTSHKLWDAIKIAGLSKKIRNGCPSWTKGEGKSEIEKVYSGLTVNPSNCVFWRMSFFAKDYEKLVSNLQSIGIKKRAIKVARDEEFLYADWYKGKYNKNDHYGIYNDNIDEYAYNRKYKCDPRVGYAEACLSEKGMEIFGIKSAVQKLKDDTIIMKIVEE